MTLVTPRAPNLPHPAADPRFREAGVFHQQPNKTVGQFSSALREDGLGNREPAGGESVLDTRGRARTRHLRGGGPSQCGYLVIICAVHSCPLDKRHTASGKKLFLEVTNIFIVPQFQRKGKMPSMSEGEGGHVGVDKDLEEIIVNWIMKRGGKTYLKILCIIPHRPGL